MATRKFAITVNEYMPALNNFADNFQADTLTADAIEAGNYELAKKKSKWSTFYSIVKGTVFVARVTLQVMSLNLPGLATELQEITGTISDTYQAFMDCKDNLKECALVRGAEWAALKAHKQLCKTRKTSKLPSEGDMKKEVDTIEIGKLFIGLTDMNKVLLKEYYEVVEFEDFSPNNKEAAVQLSDALCWVKAPEDHTVTRYNHLKDVKILCVCS